MERRGCRDRRHAHLTELLPLSLPSRLPPQPGSPYRGATASRAFALRRFWMLGHGSRLAVRVSADSFVCSPYGISVSPEPPLHRRRAPVKCFAGAAPLLSPHFVLLSPHHHHHHRVSDESSLCVSSLSGTAPVCERLKDREGRVTCVCEGGGERVCARFVPFVGSSFGRRVRIWCHRPHPLASFIPTPSIYIYMHV